MAFPKKAAPFGKGKESPKKPAAKPGVTRNSAPKVPFGKAKGKKG